jgi:hypothetical protein
MFQSPKGVEDISRKKFDGYASAQRQRNIENECEATVPVFPEGTFGDLEILSSQNNDDDTVKNITARLPEDTSNSENKHNKLNALRIRNSLGLTAAMIPQELVNTSSQIKLMTIMMARVNQSPSDTDKYRKLIFESNKKKEESSKMINDENQKQLHYKKMHL